MLLSDFAAGFSRRMLTHDVACRLGRMATGMDGGSKQVQLKMTDGRFCCPNDLLKIEQPIGIADFNNDA